MLILFTSGVLAQQLEETLYRLPKAAVVIQRQAIGRFIARGALQALGDFHGIFPAALFKPLAQHRWRNFETNRYQHVIVTFPRLRQMRARAVGDHIKTGMQPEVDLYADAIVIIVGMPA